MRKKAQYGPCEQPHGEHSKGNVPGQEWRGTAKLLRVATRQGLGYGNAACYGARLRALQNRLQRTPAKAPASSQGTFTAEALIIVHLAGDTSVFQECQEPRTDRSSYGARGSEDRLARISANRRSRARPSGRRGANSAYPGAKRSRSLAWGHQNHPLFSHDENESGANSNRANSVADSLKCPVRRTCCFGGRRSSSPTPPCEPARLPGKTAAGAGRSAPPCRAQRRRASLRCGPGDTRDPPLRPSRHTRPAQAG